MHAEPARGDPLEAPLAASLGPWRARAAAVAEVLRRCGAERTALEASLRGGPASRLTAERMMVERLGAADARRLLEALEVPAGSLAERLLEQAERHALPVIGGWDASAGAAKLYLNASDASASLRRRLRDELVPAAEGAPAAPHVIGLNLGAALVECKLYEQHGRLPQEAPAALRDWVGDMPIAGAVRSVQVGEEGLCTKAWFAAMRPSDGTVEARLRALPGWDDEEVAAVAPFEPGLVKSVGMSSCGDTRWTVYFKPRGYDGLNWRLEPEVCLTDGGAELGIYLEPRDRAPHAYERTSRYAVSYRVRHGETDARSIEHVMSWAVARVAAGEREAAIDFTSPPEPWHVVDPR